ncbi:hypothetical protein NFI96_020814 [Prochilodus magdalenae]|nr:hypothetical protein NFI96_020814 [Prochilodus magdalenae]
MSMAGSDLSVLWDRPLGGEKVRERESERDGERTEMRGDAAEMELTRRSHGQAFSQTLNQIQDSYSDSNRIMSQFQPCVNRQANQNPGQSVRLSQVPASSERLTNQGCSSEKQTGRCDTSEEKYSGAGMKALSVKEQSLSIKGRAPPTDPSGSSLGEDRQNELQYYISKLLDRSPGDPLEEQPVDQRQGEPQSANSGVSSHWESFSAGPRPAPQKPVTTPSSTHTPSALQGQADPQLEQLAGLLRLALPQANTNQQLQQLLSSLIRPEEPCTDPVRANLDLKLAQSEKREQRQPPSRSAPSTTSRGRRNGAPAQRSGSKVNAWR